MIARGDLGFLMLKSARAIGIVDEPLEAICVWALVTNTLVAPLLLAWWVNRKCRSRLHHSTLLNSATTHVDGQEFESVSDSAAYESFSDTADQAFVSFSDS